MTKVSIELTKVHDGTTNVRCYDGFILLGQHNGTTEDAALKWATDCIDACSGLTQGVISWSKNVAIKGRDTFWNEALAGRCGKGHTPTENKLAAMKGGL